MKKLILEIIYCILSIIAFISSIGVFDKQISNDFYIYFTNLSNYLCFIIMYIELFLTIKNKSLKELNLVRFISTVMIIITFLIFNFLLARTMSVSEVLSVESILMHIILPILYIYHWFLYNKKRSVKWYYIFISLIIPIIYIIFIYLRAFIIKPSNLVYPYFFLNIELIGVKNVIIWVIVLGLIITFVSYLLFLINNKKDQK